MLHERFWSTLSEEDKQTIDQYIVRSLQHWKDVMGKLPKMNECYAMMGHVATRLRNEGIAVDDMVLWSYFGEVYLQNPTLVD